jgi:hypothetical protein
MPKTRQERPIPAPLNCRGGPQSHPRGLTRAGRPLYSGRFAAPALRLATEGPCGGTGRRARLKIEFRKECWFDSGQGHQAKNINNNNYLCEWFDPIFFGKFSRCVENTRKNSLQLSSLLAFLLVSQETNLHGEFRYSEQRNLADGPQERWRARQPKLIKTDVDCRAARPKFNEGARSSAKISNVTGGGLYLFATPDESRPGDAASKLWRMPHYRATRSTSACGCLALIPRLIIAPTDSGPPSRPCLTTTRSRTLRQGMAMSSGSS